MNRWTLRLMGLMIVALFVCAGDVVEAQSALVTVVVTDVEGKPIAGATVTVTDPGDEHFKKTKVTGNKGGVKFSHNNPLPTYSYEISKDGYQTVTAEAHSEYRETVRLEVVLLPVKEGELSGKDFQQALSQSRAYTVFNDGVEAQRQGDLDLAETKFREASEIDPNLSEPHLAMAVVAYRREDFSVAAAEAELALAIDSSSVQGLLLRYDSYRRLGDVAKTAEAAEALRETDRISDVAASVFNEGLDQFKSGNNDAAEITFRQAVDLDPNLVSGYVMLGSIAISRGRYEEAVATASKALELDPGSSNALKVRYNALRNLGDAEGSKRALESLVEVDPDWVGHDLLEHATVLYEAGQMADAAVALSAVSEVLPEDVRVLFLLGMAEYNQGEIEDAKKHLNKFLQLAPDDPDAAIVREILQFASQ